MAGSLFRRAYGWMVGREARRSIDGDGWGDVYFNSLHGVRSATGVWIDQATAMACSTVMACVRMLAMDLAKADVDVFREEPNKPREVAADHVLHALLEDPNDWQTGLEFRAQMQMGLVLRGNAYAVIVRDGRGNPLYFVPISPDYCQLWESPDGSLWYMVTRVGLHQRAVLENEPLLIPSRDVLHLRNLTANGLTGLSPIAMNRETIGLGLAQEQLAARWMGQGARPSGILTTDGKLTEDSAARAKKNWLDAQSGIVNSGKVAVLEGGLKWQPLSMTSQDLEFIASRRFQIEEIARIFRIPFPMVSEVGSSARTDPDVLAQHYVNYTISDYTRIWSSALSKKFDLRSQNLRVRFDLGVLLEADLATRINMHRLAVLGGLETQNEGRYGVGLDRLENDDYDKLLTPANSTPYGSDKSGDAPDGAGRPKQDGTGNADQPGASK